MARSFTNAKVISALVAERISLVATTSRGYAAAAAGGASPVASSGMRSSGGGRSSMNVILKKQGGRSGGEDSSSSSKKSGTTSWVPDPVTGYYRPEAHTNEIDAAELRNLLLNHKN